MAASAASLWALHLVVAGGGRDKNQANRAARKQQQKFAPLLPLLHLRKFSIFTFTLRKRAVTARLRPQKQARTNTKQSRRDKFVTLSERSAVIY